MNPTRQLSTAKNARTALYPHEVAEKIGCSVEHLGDLIEEGVLKAVNIAGAGNITDRRCLRVPPEALQAFLEKRSTTASRPTPKAIRK